jgi:hypothetical protein
MARTATKIGKAKDGFLRQRKLVKTESTWEIYDTIVYNSLVLELILNKLLQPCKRKDFLKTDVEPLYFVGKVDNIAYFFSSAIFNSIHVFYCKKNVS